MLSYNTYTLFFLLSGVSVSSLPCPQQYTIDCVAKCPYGDLTCMDPCTIKCDRKECRSVMSNSSTIIIIVVIVFACICCSIRMRRTISAFCCFCQTHNHVPIQTVHDVQTNTPAYTIQNLTQPLNQPPAYNPVYNV